MEKIAGFYEVYDDFKDLCCRAWAKDFNYLYFDKSKKKEEGKNSMQNESKNTYNECTLEIYPFNFADP